MNALLWVVPKWNSCWLKPGQPSLWCNGLFSTISWKQAIHSCSLFHNRQAWLVHMLDLWSSIYNSRACSIILNLGFLTFFHHIAEHHVNPSSLSACQFSSTSSWSFQSAPCHTPNLSLTAYSWGSPKQKFYPLVFISPSLTSSISYLLAHFEVKYSSKNTLYHNAVKTTLKTGIRSCMVNISGSVTDASHKGHLQNFGIES